MRAIFAAPAFLLLTPIAFADDAATASTDAVYACASLSADAERLACYDDAVRRLKDAEEAGEVTTVTRTEVEQVQKEAFGFSLPSLPKLAMPRFGNGSGEANDGTLDSLTIAVTSIKSRKIGGITVTLENGQVWQQTDTRKVSYSKRRGVKEATVKRASFGSFMIKLDGGVAFRAKRIK